MQHKPYTTTRIKTRNYLSNIVYHGVIREDFYKRNIVFDISILLTKNLNTFSLEREIAEQNKHEMIYMLWKEGMPAGFYVFIYQEENFLYLNGKNVLHPRFSDMVCSFISHDGKNYELLRDNFCRFKDIFQYTYSIVYLGIYCSTERRGFDLKSSFQLVFKACKDEKRGAAQERAL